MYDYPTYEIIVIIKNIGEHYWVGIYFVSDINIKTTVK